MKGKNAFDAIEGIDTRYILEAAPDAPAYRGSKLRYIRIGAVAASLAVVTAAVLLGVGILRESGEAPSVPPAGGTGELETPTGGENAPLPPLNGSYTTDLYTVEEIDGKHYIHFADGNEKPAPESGGSTNVIKGLYFNSVEEMREKFLNGSFTADEVKNLKSQLTLTDKGFEIPDMTKLYDAVLPEGWSVYRVCLDENDIYISVQNDKTFNESADDDTGESGFIAIHTDEHYDMVYQSYFVSYVQQYKDSIVRDETTFHGMPCDVYKRVSNGVNRKDVVMRVPIGGEAFDTLIKYRVKETGAEVNNWGAPYSVSMYGEAFGQKIEIYLSGFESDPQGDFYQSFGIAPYQSTIVNVK